MLWSPQGEATPQGITRLFVSVSVSVFLSAECNFYTSDVCSVVVDIMCVCGVMSNCHRGGWGPHDPKHPEVCGGFNPDMGAEKLQLAAPLAWW